MRSLVAVNPRFPGEGSSSQGQSGPKSRPMGVDDGQQVNIPAPPKFKLEVRRLGKQPPIESGGPARGCGGFGQSRLFKETAKKSSGVY